MPSKVTTSKGLPTSPLFEEEFSSLHRECLNGTVEDIRNYFKNGNKIKEYDSGFTPLHVVVLSGRRDAPEVIDELLDNDVNIDAGGKEEEKTALHLVAEHGIFPQAFPIVAKLLERGADTTLRDRRIRTAYDLALARNNHVLAATLDGTMDQEELQQFYYQKMAKIFGPYLIQAVIESDEESFNKNLECHADPNLLNQHGAGAIHYSITHCTLPTLQTLQSLIDAGADVNLKDHENDTALNLAIKTEKLKKNGTMAKVVSLLLKHGADQTIQDLDGRNAHDLASKRGYNDIVNLLKKTKPAKREDSFVAQTPVPETPRRTPVERAPVSNIHRSPSKSPSKSLKKSESPVKSPTPVVPPKTPEPEPEPDPQPEQPKEEEPAKKAESKKKPEQKKSGTCVIS